MRKTKFILIFLTLAFINSSCENKNTEGEYIYNTHCINCHQEGGKGVGKLIPPISGEFLKDNYNVLPCIIKHGLSEKIIINNIEYNDVMPRNDKITDVDITNILNYVNQEFCAGINEEYTLEGVKKSLRNCR